MIMRTIYNVLLIFAFLGFAACQEEPTDMIGEGRVRLNITDRVLSKAMPDALTPELTNQFLVRMVRTNDNRLVFGGTCAVFNAKPQLFKSGEHTIQVSYGDNPVIAMDAPYYVSEEKKITVEAGKEQEVVLQCSVGNALASFDFVNADKLEKVLKDYYIEVVVKGESVKWYPGSPENPYFKAGNEVEFYLKGTWIENGLPYSKKFAGFQPIEAGKRYHYKLKFDTSSMTGAILDIEVDANIENVTVNQTLPQDWLPKPKITADGFDEENQLIYTETADAATAEIHFAAVRPVQDVELTLNFADPKLAALNKTYVFSSLTEEDKEALQNAAILLPALDETTTSGGINLTAMTSSLLTLDGGLDADNQIRLRVKANDRWSDETNYTIKTVKPVFNIGVYPGNIWTKEFTVNPLVADSVKTGDYTRFKDITYEFSADGNNWTELAADLRKEGLIPGTTYYVRPKYRGQVPGEIFEISTESTETIPNTNMEQWNDYKLGTGPHNVPFYEPNMSDVEVKYWTTNNARSTVYRQAALVYQSTTYPTVSKTKTAYNGTYAAEIRTIGCAKNNAVSSASIFLPGKLFIGDYNYTGSSRPWDGTETIIKGHDFSAKPTKLTFMYQYLPYSGSGEKFLCEIELRHQNTVLGKGTFTGSNQDNYTMGTVDIDYTAMDITLPIDNIYVMFKSSESESPAGKNWIKNLTLEGYGSNWAAYLGSVLRIDDISLIYDK